MKYLVLWTYILEYAPAGSTYNYTTPVPCHQLFSNFDEAKRFADGQNNLPTANAIILEVKQVGNDKQT